MSATKFVGHYKQNKVENFDLFMRTLGVGMVLRKIGNTSNPDLTFEHIDGEHYKIKEWTMVKSHMLDFTLGVEFKNKTLDGRNTLTTVTFDGEKLVIFEKSADGKSKSPTAIWKMTDDNDVQVTLEVEGVVAEKVYKRLES